MESNVSTAPRFGVAIKLNDLDALLKQFVKESQPSLLTQLHLSTFLIWLKKKMEENTNGTTKTTNGAGNGN